MRASCSACGVKISIGTCQASISANLFRIRSGRFSHLFSDEKAFERTFDVSAMVLLGALTLRLVEKYVLVADRANLEWRIEEFRHFHGSFV